MNVRTDVARATCAVRTSGRVLIVLFGLVVQTATFSPAQPSPAPSAVTAIEVESASLIPPSVETNKQLDVLGPINRPVSKETLGKALDFARKTAPASPEKIVATALTAVALAGDVNDRRSSAQVRRLRDLFLDPNKSEESIFRNANFQRNMLLVLDDGNKGTRIFGGKEAPRNEFQNCVLIGDTTRYFCSGVLVSDQLVLTAGHCADGEQPTRVLFGTGEDDPRAAVFEVDGVPERNPGYAKDQNYLNDLTLIVLRDKVSTTVRPAKIAPSTIFSPQQFRTVRLVGFGMSDEQARQGFGVKRYGDTAVVSPDCQQSGDEKYGGHPGLEFVAGDQRVDTCRGDSGGPVFWENSQKEWLLVGTTSRWTANHTHICGDGGVYVRTDRYSQWITEVAGRRHVAAPERFPAIF
jgi:hypothetical protein